jgi:hypothetical protein
MTQEIFNESDLEDARAKLHALVENVIKQRMSVATATLNAIVQTETAVGSPHHQCHRICVHLCK